MNRRLLGAIAENGTTQKELAKGMGIDPRTFSNKLHHRKQPNGNEARFTESEKYYLAMKLDLLVSDVD